MEIIYKATAITFILAIFGNIYKDRNNRSNVIFTLVIIAILDIISGLRSNIGDTYFYMHTYELIASGEQITEGYEPGFLLLFNILVSISSDPKLMILFTGIITTSINIWMLRRYTSIFELEVFLYIATGYFVVTMNGIRQGLVAAIMFACTRFIIKGKLIPYIIITLLMSTFHSSVLIMIPVYFIVRNEAWSNKMKKIVCISIIALFCIQPLMKIIFEVVEGTKYSGYESDVLNGGEGGSSPMRLIIASVPILLAYVYRGDLKQKWPESNIFINMSIVNLIVYAFSLYNWVFARFTFYFELYAIVLLPYCIKVMNNKKARDLIYFSLIICYIIFMYLDQSVSQGIDYQSDFF